MVGTPVAASKHILGVVTTGLLQDLASYLGIDELSSTASFPAVMDKFKTTLTKVEACSAARAHVEGSTATLCANIKAGELYE